MSKRVWIRVSVLVLLAGLLGASAIGCVPQAQPTQAPLATEEEQAPEPEPTEAAEEEESANLVLATTTSTQDSGLLDYILQDFEAEYGVTVEVIAVGTGQAIALGEDGNADVLLVHARAREDAFMDAGHGIRREDVMYNDFVIVGPASDPAEIEGIVEAPQAFQEIATAEAQFVSRGDDSGTHTKERAIWAEAGVEPTGDWYVSAGQGMGAVLTMADEQQAYTLSDRATYLARTLEGTELVILVEGDPILFNPYGVIAVNPDKSPEINNELANQFIDWLIAVPTQEMIGEFGVEDFGSPLFTPDSDPWREAHADVGPTGEVVLRITGPAAEIAFTEDDLKGMETLDVDYTGKDGETTTYMGVLLSRLLEDAGALEGATIVFVASDGYTAEIELAEVASCENCIVAFDPDGGLRSILPDQSGKLQVKGLVEIQVN